VDGTLTDGTLFTDANGEGPRVFNTLDGFAIRWFEKMGGVTIWATGKESPANLQRARNLGVRHVLQSSQDKVADVAPLLARLGIDWSELAVVGDDLPEFALMKRCAFPIATANAVEDIKRIARYVTRLKGGEGAVREAYEHVLRQDGRWMQVLRHYGAGGTDEDVAGRA
jgi:3-deoxy-D-manno-octulosonate 8-phosphate phosphatase (KDO 8-P phosphatase)